MKYTHLSWVQSLQRQFRRARYHFYLLVFIILFPSFVVSSDETKSSTDLAEGQQSLYIVKEIVEVTSDWTEVTWIQGPDIVAERHEVLEGADTAGLKYTVSGLSVWVGKNSYDATKIVIEIEALALRGDVAASVNLTKGHIEYTKVEVYAYNLTSVDFAKFGELLNEGINPAVFELELSMLYNMPSATANIERVLKS
jgi:hypothetical protein